MGAAGYNIGTVETGKTQGIIVNKIKIDNLFSDVGAFFKQAN